MEVAPDSEGSVVHNSLLADRDHHASNRDIPTTSNSDIENPLTIKTEAKLSLSDYHSVRSMSASGEDTPLTQSEERTTLDFEEKVVDNVAVKIRAMDALPKTSTPVRENASLHGDAGAGVSAISRRGTRSTSLNNNAGSSNIVQQRLKKVSFIDPLDIRAPLVGFEVMEQRPKFTVFKMQVHIGASDNWFVFRRFTDFVQLQQKLKVLYPMFRLALPPKRWFRNNYEREFLDDRLLGLQTFIDSVLCHSDLSNCVPVQEFFCFTDPPGPHDSLEESRAYCDKLEDYVYNLKKEIHAKDTEVELVREELSLYKSQVEMLSRALREANANGATNGTVPSPVSSLAECDLLAPEADQSIHLSLKDEIIQSEAIKQREIVQSEVPEQENHSDVHPKENSAKKKQKHKRNSAIVTATSAVLIS